MSTDDTKPTQQPKSTDMTPKSAKMMKKINDSKKLQQLMQNIKYTQDLAFVVGISGGDCAGKKQLLNYMFTNNGNSWVIQHPQETVAILNQDYFRINQQNKFSAKGTDWQAFTTAALNLATGNPVTIEKKKNSISTKVTIQPTKLLVLQGCHIFMSQQVTQGLFDMINLKVFIDSDSDVRLSRRIYKDTQDDKQQLNQSIERYLTKIKPSYQSQIEPTKMKSDIILPHFGGGYDDHKNQRIKNTSIQPNIKAACSLILTHLKMQMKKFQEEFQDNQIQIKK